MAMTSSSRQVWAARDSKHRYRYGSTLYTGTTTLIIGSNFIPPR